MCLFFLISFLFLTAEFIVFGHIWNWASPYEFHNSTDYFHVSWFLFYCPSLLFIFLLYNFIYYATLHLAGYCIQLDLVCFFQMLSRWLIHQIFIKYCSLEDAVSRMLSPCQGRFRRLPGLYFGRPSVWLGSFPHVYFAGTAFPIIFVFKN